MSKTQSLPLSPSTPKALRRGTLRESLLYLGDTQRVLRLLPDRSIHLVIADPPYFLHHMDGGWAVKRREAGGDGSVVASLPPGMKFDPARGVQLQAFMRPIFAELIRVLKPGGYCVAFSQGRLYHRMGVAAEDAGFEVRDLLCWLRDGQAKAASHDHFVKRRGLPPEEEARIITSIGGRKTPQLRPLIEPMVLAQKPREGTFIDNWMKHGVGLVDTTQSLDGKFPATLMKVSKPTTTERGPGNEHPTVKPTALISHLIRLLSVEGQIVLDPFMGSGSHGVAAALTDRRFIGVEIEPTYFDLAVNRIRAARGSVRAGGRKPVRFEDIRFRHPPFKRDWTDAHPMGRFAA